MEISKKQLELIISMAENLGRVNANVQHAGLLKGNVDLYEYFKKESVKQEKQLKEYISFLEKNKK